MLVLVEARDAAEVDHGASLPSPLAHRASLHRPFGCVSSAVKTVIWDRVLLHCFVAYCGYCGPRGPTKGSLKMYLPPLLRRNLALVALSIWVMPNALAGDAGQCLAIQNSDRRAMCMALATNNSGQCLAIQNGDSRAYCMAVATGQSGQCLAIQNPDTRSMCMSQTN